VLLPNTKSAIGKLKLYNYILIVVTNQPDIGNGIIDADEVEMMQNRL